VFILGLAALAIELASLMLLLRLGSFMLWLNLAALVLSTSINWIAAQHIGLAGAALGSVIVIYIDRIASLWRISRETRIPVRDLQEWRGLALPLALSAGAGLCAWLGVARLLPSQDHVLRAFLGGLVLVLSYVALRALCGMDRGLHRAVREFAHRF
jgi:O-antigen/teichoic acid export membrane protein